MSTCVILQPSYIPWRGYFHQIARADVFVFYDDVQFDKHGWRNRNRIKTANGPTWLTIPVLAKGAVSGGTTIREIAIDWRRDWAQKHLTALRQSYARAPFTTRYLPIVEAHLSRRDGLLADLTIDLTIALARELGIQHTRFLRSSTLGVSGERTDRLVEIVKRTGANHYLSGPSAQAYLEPEKLERAGISLEYMKYDYAPYEQLHGAFEGQVTVLDLMFMRGPEAGQSIWGMQGPAMPHRDAPG